MLERPAMTRAGSGLVALVLVALVACGPETTTKTATPASTTSTSDDTTTTTGAVSGTAYVGPATTVPVRPPAPRGTTTTAVTGPPATTTPPPPPLPVEGSGVRGTITAGPTCPVERVDQPCPPRPVSADVEAVGGNGQVARRTHSDAEGRYAMALAPGEYDVRVVTEGPFPSCSPVHVSIRPGQVTTADIDCDTGIR